MTVCGAGLRGCAESGSFSCAQSVGLLIVEPIGVEETQVVGCVAGPFADRLARGHCSGQRARRRSLC